MTIKSTTKTKRKKFKFTKEQKDWLKALRSGKFKKTTGRLSDISRGQKQMTNCCLGVACEIFKERAELKVETDEDFGDFLTYDGNEGIAPLSIVRLLHLRGVSGDLDEPVQIGRHSCDSLAEVNDETSYGFKKVADFIEKNPYLVFDNND